ncbi:gamma-glutamylcyclotransferase family protein [Frankia sp. AgB32]|uniref:gamma-glutamylcyclotransferase family protein n=1 Tax=Frankia sp. AgB32 TaxID=631119 RepID=UPI00200C7148|nr:gamma-glutamylcyclotransferase family protein [Frankia sp. AgB32]MCK9895884.1 gamma-glutamylcyclotransferase [Frankia sp. AgB32]
MSPTADRRPPAATAPAAGSEPDLFVYGTLMFPEVLSTLIGRVPVMEPASAPGWRAAPLRDRVYPGLVRQPDAQRAAAHLLNLRVPSTRVAGGDRAEKVAAAAAGRRLRGLTAEERAVFDAFEGAAYDAGPLVLADGRACVAYLWLDPGEVIVGTWDAERFAECHLSWYVRRCAAWRARLADPTF